MLVPEAEQDRLPRSLPTGVSHHTMLDYACSGSQLVGSLVRALLAEQTRADDSASVKLPASDRAQVPEPEPVYVPGSEAVRCPSERLEHEAVPVAAPVPAQPFERQCAGDLPPPRGVRGSTS
jgi:hypothetical protein